jgi:hypothetical protein
MFTAHKFTVDIVEYFVAVDIAMVVRCRYSLWMVVVQAWYEGADYESGCIKGLMYRWWLVYPASDGLKIMNAESVWVLVTIPAYYIEGMGAVPSGTLTFRQWFVNFPVYEYRARRKERVPAVVRTCLNSVWETV